MAYLGKTPSQAVRSRYYFTASGSETSLSPSEVTGLSFTDANYVDVSLNGVALVSGTDYTATPSTNTISGLAALTASDVVEIVVYDTFSVFGGNVNGDFNISGGTLSAEAVTVTGLTTTGNVNFGDNDKAIFGAGSDLQVFHDATDSHVVTTNGDLNLQVAGAGTINLGDQFGNTLLKVVDNADVKLYHGTTPSEKLATTSTGIDVTGRITTDGITSSGTYVVESTSYFVGNAAQGYRFNNAADTTNLLVIKDSGNVGIADASPQDTLHVGGTGTTGIKIGTQGSTGRARIFVDSGNDYALTVDTQNVSDALVINRTTGAVGIGTDSPSEELTVSKSDDARISITSSGTGKAAMTGLLEFDGSDGRHGYIGPVGGVMRLNTDGGYDILFQPGGTEKVRFTSTGLVGIGTSSPQSDLSVKVSASRQLDVIKDSGDDHLVLKSSAPDASYNLRSIELAGERVAFSTGASSGTSYTERMRIDSSGKVLVNTTDDTANSIMTLAYTTYPLAIWNNGGTSGYFGQIRFRNNANTSNIGTIIRTNDASVSYNTTSDYRAKENVEDMIGAIDRVKQLAPKRFNFIADTSRRVDGFLAHEAQDVVPEAVHGTHNEVDEDGNPVMQGIDQSKLVPLLTGALQEAIAKIEALETTNADLIARIETLENA